MKKNLLVAGLASATILGSTLLGGAVLAHGGGGMGGSPEDFAQKLATKFNLNADEVKSFLEQERETRRAEMDAKFSEALDKAVSEGKITAEQKALILAHREENQAKKEEIRNMTDETARKEAMDALHEANKSWAEANGIDMRELGLPKPDRPHGPRQ